MNKRLRFILLILIIFEILMSGLILYADFGGSVACPASGEGCDFVTGSIYGEIFGVKVSVFGLLAFIGLLALYLASMNKYAFVLFRFGAVVGGLFALYFLYLQAFVLHAMCTRCLFVDLVALLIAVFVIVDYLKHRKN